MWLKAQFHFHTGVDPKDGYIKYSPYQAIDIASQKGFKLLSFTHHKQLVFSVDWQKYAASKGILLIPGVEYEIYHRHIVILNADADIHKVKTFEDLRAYKASRNVFVIAPHPFYPGSWWLGAYLHKYPELWDAIEFSLFYSYRFLQGPNQKAVKFADKHNLPVVGTGDVHFLRYLEDTYSLIKTDYFVDEDMEESNYGKIIDNIFQNMREHKVKIVTHPMSLLEAGIYGWTFVKEWSKYKISSFFKGKTKVNILKD